MEKLIELGKKSLTDLEHFLTSRLSLNHPQTDEELQILLHSQNDSDWKSLNSVLIEIHQQWNNGTFKDFEDYRYLDKIIYIRLPALSSPVFPKPIQKAADTLSQKLEDKKYRIKFHYFQNYCFQCVCLSSVSH